MIRLSFVAALTSSLLLDIDVMPLMVLGSPLTDALATHIVTNTGEDQ